MATLCRNCGGALVFKPSINKMYCQKCGGTFRADEVEAEDKEYLEDSDVISMEEVYGFKDASFIDCNIYTCSHCGGEVIVNNSEVSTYCIYCGNPTVVFSRISKQKRPEFILPFSVTKDQAISLVQSRIRQGFFIPSKLKKMKIENARGIYIPYWIVNLEHREAVFYSGSVKHGKRSRTAYFERAGDCYFKNLPLDASIKLNDESSSRLEMFELWKMKPFDEEYLSGFY